MRRIKLFENFNQLDPKEIVSDIETIIYELDEKEYDVKIFFKSPFLDGYINTSSNVETVTDIIISPVYKKSEYHILYLLTHR